MESTPTPSFARRALRRIGILMGTVANGAVAIGLTFAGVTLIQARATGVTVEEAAAPITVRTSPLEIRAGYDVPQTFIGQVEAQQETSLSFEQGGRIADILVEEGDAVRSGQVLARLDTRTLMNERAALLAQRAALEAQAELAKLTTERQSALEERGFSSTQAFDQARLQLAQLQAEIAAVDVSVEGIDISISKADLIAPFSGLIGGRLADVGTQAGPSTPVLTLLENEAPILRVGLSTTAAEGLSIGDTFEAQIGDVSYSVTLQSLRPDLNLTTRTRPALFAINTDGPVPLYGQTGEVTLTRTVTDEGFWVPVAALRDGTNGVWTILTVPEGENTVASAAVEVLYSDESRAFVRGGLPAGALLVDTGPHRVVPGQIVADTGE